MLWFLLAAMVVIGAILAMQRRRRYESPRDEPWRASLASDDEPLEMDEIRRAEEEWLEESGWEDQPEDDSWR